MSSFASLREDIEVMMELEVSGTAVRANGAVGQYNEWLKENPKYALTPDLRRYNLTCALGLRLAVWYKNFRDCFFALYH